MTARRSTNDILRKVVAQQTQSFRATQFAAGDVICPVTGRVLTWHTSDVDHVPPATFATLIRAWTSKELVAEHEVESVALMCHRGWLPDQETIVGRTGRRIHIVGLELARSFFSFHEEHAVLRMLDRSTNRSCTCDCGRLAAAKHGGVTLAHVQGAIGCAHEGKLPWE